LIYDSLFGNTKKVAISLSRGLEAGGIQVDTCSIRDFDINEFKNYDAIGIGGPTHIRGASKPMKSFLSKIRLLKLKNKQAFAFETKISHPLAGSAAKRILKYLKKRRLKIIHPKITAIVVGRKGPLEENTLIKMEKIGLQIAEILNKII